MINKELIRYENCILDETHLLISADLYFQCLYCGKEIHFMGRALNKEELAKLNGYYADVLGIDELSFIPESDMKELRSGLCRECIEQVAKTPF